MEIEVRENLELNLYGFSGPVPDFKYGQTGVALSSRIWDIVRANKLPNNGINVWVYDSQVAMFTGIEMDPPPSKEFGFEVRHLHFKKYAWYKHVGPYEKLFEANAKMREDLAKRAIKYGPPSLEIYGHHGPDANKLETEIIYTLY